MLTTHSLCNIPANMSRYCDADNLIEINVRPEEDDFPDAEYYHNPDDLVNLHVDPDEDTFHDDKVRKYKIRRRAKLVKKSKKIIAKIFKKYIKLHSKEICRCNARRCLGKGWRRSYEKRPSCRLRTIRRYSCKVKCGNSIKRVHVRNCNLEAVERQYTEIPCSCNNSHCLGIDLNEFDQEVEIDCWPGGPRYFYKK